MKLRARHLILAPVVGGLVALALTSGRVGPANLYPDPKLTPGKADTLSLSDLQAKYDGLTYSQAHRNVSSAEKNQVMAEYGVSSTGEIDHFYPLCAGGSNDITNLWPQPEHNLWQGKDFGFRAKDKLETYLCAQIKAGKLDPKDAYSCIVGDWVKCYEKNAQNLDNQTFGSAIE